MQNYSPKHYKTVNVNPDARWSIYQRLQALGVSCTCRLHQPLQIEITTPVAAIQVWQVVRGETTPRSQLITWLENCWRHQEITHNN